MKEVNSVSDATNIYGEDIKLTTTDASTLYKTIITELEKGAGEPLYPGDERRIFGEALVPVFVALYNSLNDVGRQTLLRYARGEVLDAIGERQDVKRLEGTPAKTTMRFSVSTPQEKNIIIPKWTKVTPDSENYFATDEIAVLQAGTYSVEVPTSAVSNGTKLFLSTPSARRATRRRTAAPLFSGYFYPRPPRGGRLPADPLGLRVEVFLSTPSARRATTVPSWTRGPSANFYPRPPRGGRRRTFLNLDEFGEFLSTPSARRATVHVLVFFDLFQFLSTPSARRATVLGSW